MLETRIWNSGDQAPGASLVWVLPVTVCEIRLACNLVTRIRDSGGQVLGDLWEISGSFFTRTLLHQEIVFARIEGTPIGTLWEFVAR